MSDTFDPQSIVWVLDQTTLDVLLGAIETTTEVVLDLETTGLDEYAMGEDHRNGGVPARIVLASLTLPQPDDPSQPTTWVVPLSHPDSPWLGSWRRVMRQIARQIVVHERPLSNQNVKFDARWVFAQTGVDLSARIWWDTQVASHLLDETTSTKLKERVPAVFGVDRWDDFDLSYPGAAEEVPMFDLGVYAARDTYWTWVLAEWQRHQMFLDEDAREPETPEEVEHARLGRLALWCSMPTVATLTGIEQVGIVVDREWMLRERIERREAVATLSATLASMYVLPEKRQDQPPSWAPTSHWFRDWTAAAVEAGDLKVTEMSPTGKPMWTRQVLMRQAHNGSKVAAMLLDLRRHTKRIEFLSSWLHLATTEAHEIHAQYNVGSVATGRLSSSNPNMQQVTAALKEGFVPHEGYYFAEFDYSQIELRVAAHISGCVPMIEAFRRGDDLHTLLAARITGKDPADVTKDERQSGKSANFGLLYGMGAFGFQAYAETVYGVVLTRKQAQEVHRTFFETWEGLAEWHYKSGERARREAKAVSPLGRVRRLPNVWTDDTGASERAAINSPVQGMASDLMQMAAASIMGRMPGTDAVPGVRLVGTVHDSILVEVPIDGWEDAVAACSRRMLDLSEPLRRLECDLTVPLAVDVKVGTRWGRDDVSGA